jgi:hypothetical protein
LATGKLLTSFEEVGRLPVVPKKIKLLKDIADRVDVFPL